MCANLELYNQLRTVPAEAKKTIGAGRLKGKTDINPMWRIKMLTQHFGICGIGWKTEVVRMWLEHGAENVVTANVHIRLYVKDSETKEWSDAIEGIGGAAFVAKENGGLYTDDDCYKKAYTDAISIACKALGMAADVYYEKDPDSKYTGGEGGNGDGGNNAPNTSPRAPRPDKLKEHGLPFPEAAPLPTYEQALNFVVPYGEQKITLKELYKLDRNAIGELFRSPFTNDATRNAIKVIEAAIANHNAK